MRISLSTTIVLAAATCLHAQVGVGAGLKVSEGAVRDFHLAIGAHFGIEERAVVVLSTEIPDSELPVVLHLAARAKVPPAAIVALRREKKSWMDITLHFGLSPEIFHVPVAIAPGPPYGRAYGYFRNRPRSGWGEIRLDDEEIVHLVSVKFLSDHHRCLPEDVLRIEVGSGGLVELHGKLKRSGNAGRSPDKGTHKPPAAARKAKHHGKGRGQDRKG